MYCRHSAKIWPAAVGNADRVRPVLLVDAADSMAGCSPNSANPVCPSVKLFVRGRKLHKRFFGDNVRQNRWIDFSYAKVKQVRRQHGPAVAQVAVIFVVSSSQAKRLLNCRNTRPTEAPSAGVNPKCYKPLMFGPNVPAPINSMSLGKSRLAFASCPCGVTFTVVDDNVKIDTGGMLGKVEGQIELGNMSL